MTQPLLFRSRYTLPYVGSISSGDQRLSWALAQHDKTEVHFTASAAECLGCGRLALLPTISDSNIVSSGPIPLDGLENMPRVHSVKPEEYIPLRPAVYGILLALGDRELHGYAIMQSLAEQTGGRERLLPGTLYSSLARMVEDGLVEELEPADDDVSGGPQRRYYRRTAFGRTVARAESERLRTLLDIAVAQRIVPGVTG